MKVLFVDDACSTDSGGFVEFTEAPVTPIDAAAWESLQQDLLQYSAHEIICCDLDISGIHGDAVLGLPKVKDDLVARPKFMRPILIHDLNTEAIELLRPLQAEVEGYDEEFIAKNIELDLWASANTESEAILLLKKEICDLWADLNEDDGVPLGKLPLMWKRILSDRIRERGNA